MKEIKDYLHLYYGATIFYPETNETTTICWTHLLDVFSTEKRGEEYKPNLKFALRPLSDITLEEMKMIEITDYDFMITNMKLGCEMNFTATQFNYMLSKHFDLFNLIPDGLAIDKTKIEIWKKN